MNKPLNKLEEIASKSKDILNDIRKDVSNKSSFESDTILERQQNNNRRTEELENEKRAEDNKDIKFNRILRLVFSIITFIYMLVYTFVVIKLLTSSEKDLSPLVYTIPASMIMFGWVLQGLFPASK